MKSLYVLCTFVLFSFMGTFLYAEENADYDFNDTEFEKKLFSFAGYSEFFPSLFIADRKAALYRLKYHDNDPGNPYADAYARLQPEATLEKGIFKAFVRANGYAEYAENEWNYDALLYEGYATLKPNEHIIIDSGKKTMKWGKGYAWNPAAFIDRPKNPDDPELANEGFVIASTDFIFSFNSPLKTVALTPVAVPVYKKINDDFSETEDWNYAGKLYLLFFDTDIDIMFLAGDSRDDRYGADISRNIGTNFEIHGEFAYIPDYTKRYFDSSGVVREKIFNASSVLAGIKYLTEKETTYIIEYYYNGTGMSKNDMKNYYNFIDRAYSSYLETGSKTLLNKASMITEGNYGKMSPMKNYLYARISQKEPFDILYFTPALSSIVNIDDSSFSLTPELLYTGINNFEFRFRYTWLYGNDNSEYGEKPADHKFDLRIRYFF
ncbi:MAG: hypothetical protein V1874_15365 [Spirochaetota bacterium]